MLKYDFHNSVGYWIFSTAHEMSQRMNDELADLDITFRQWEVLGWLSFFGEISQADLAKGMLIEPPTLAGILDRMERDDWIERTPDPADGRRKIVRPTDRVEPVWSKMVERARRVRSEATAGISPADLETTRKTLEQMRRNLAGDERIDIVEKRAREQTD
ncbi:MAG: MarR family transcriptional regulator [Planctomycetota bacterium]